MLPVPLNSSKITSSMRLPVSMRAVAMIVSDPPSSTLRAAPKKRFGRCRALASTPPDSTLPDGRSEEHTSELQSQSNLVCRLLLEKKKKQHDDTTQLYT